MKTDAIITVIYFRQPIDNIMISKEKWDKLTERMKKRVLAARLREIKIS